MLDPRADVRDGRRFVAAWCVLLLSVVSTFSPSHYLPSRTVVLAIAFTVYATLKNVYDDDDDGMVLEGSRCPGGTNISTLGMMDHSDRGWTVDSKRDRWLDCNTNGFKRSAETTARSCLRFDTNFSSTVIWLTTHLNGALAKMTILSEAIVCPAVMCTGPGHDHRYGRGLGLHTAVVTGDRQSWPAPGL